MDAKITGTVKPVLSIVLFKSLAESARATVETIYDLLFICNRNGEG